MVRIRNVFESADTLAEALGLSNERPDASKELLAFKAASCTVNQALSLQACRSRARADHSSFVTPPAATRSAGHSKTQTGLR